MGIENNRLIHKAYGYATHAHRKQRYGTFSYGYHLHDVYTILTDFGVTNRTLLAAAYLHDILEDTDTTTEELSLEFGKDVAALVVAVTDEKGYPNRKETKAATYPKIRAAGAKAVLLKLADRLANIESGLGDESKFLEMYRKEHADFRAALYVPGENEDLWDAIEAALREDL